jgi:two-component system alkaline phosphatase synthesis response regulator PhoP
MSEMPEIRILVVDDEKNIRELVRYNLESRGYVVSEAKNGQEAIEKAKTQLPSLIVLDLMLPEIDGLEVCRILKGNSSTKKIPIIMLTALGSEVDKIVGLELGADDYITKPFSPRELVARVRAVLRRAFENENKDNINIEGLVIDNERREVYLDGSRIEMTLKEFDLLRLLAQNPFRVFTREQLLEKVWGFDYPGDTRTIDVHICSLRRKLENKKGNHNYFIETIRGIGYKFGHKGK